jgi:hypothetical protein
MKYILMILCLLLSAELYGTPGTQYKVTMNDGSIRIVDVSRIEKDGSLLLTDKSRISTGEIQSIRLSINTDRKKHVTIIDNNGSAEYVDGVIAFRDLKRFTVVDEQERLNIFQSRQMVDIISREYFYSERAKTREAALGLSMVYPGEGQKYNGRDIAGYTLFTSSILFGTLSVKYYVDSHKAYTNYKKSGNLDLEAYRVHRDSTRRANQYSLLLLLTYMYNLYDSYYGYKVRFPQNKYNPDKEIEENEVSLFTHSIPINW